MSQGSIIMIARYKPACMLIEYEFPKIYQTASSISVYHWWKIVWNWRTEFRIVLRIWNVGQKRTHCTKCPAMGLHIESRDRKFCEWLYQHYLRILTCASCLSVCYNSMHRSLNEEGLILSEKITLYLDPYVEFSTNGKWLLQQLNTPDPPSK